MPSQLEDKSLKYAAVWEWVKSWFFFFWQLLFDHICTTCLFHQLDWWKHDDIIFDKCIWLIMYWICTWMYFSLRGVHQVVPNNSAHYSLKGNAIFFSLGHIHRVPVLSLNVHLSLDITASRGHLGRAELL